MKRFCNSASLSFGRNSLALFFPTLGCCNLYGTNEWTLFLVIYSTPVLSFSLLVSLLLITWINLDLLYDRRGLDCFSLRFQLTYLNRKSLLASALVFSC
jgi:hypothetical protein